MLDRCTMFHSVWNKTWRIQLSCPSCILPLFSWPSQGRLTLPHSDRRTAPWKWDSGKHSSPNNGVNVVYFHSIVFFVWQPSLQVLRLFSLPIGYRSSPSVRSAWLVSFRMHILSVTLDIVFAGEKHTTDVANRICLSPHTLALVFREVIFPVEGLPTSLAHLSCQKNFSVASCGHFCMNLNINFNPVRAGM